MQGKTGIIAIICCGVFEQDIKERASMNPNIKSIRYLKMALHLNPDELNKTLQNMIFEIENDPDVEFIVLVYGLCGMGVANLMTTQSKLVIPKVHDCISLFLGSKKRYDDLMKNEPARYWYTPGWNKEKLVPGKERYEQMKAEYTDKYDAEDIDYLIDSDKQSFSYVKKASFVSFNNQTHRSDIQYTHQCAKYMNWDIEEIEGNSSYIDRLIKGDWSENDFLIVQPGEKVVASNDKHVISKRSVD